MSLTYRIMYRVGFTPWDTQEVPPELTSIVEGPHALPAGRALDIGCGTGTHAVYLAQRGWQVSAIDAVPRPLARARARARSAGVPVDWILGDAARLDRLGLEPGFTLVFDRGCFQGLDDSKRAACAEAVTDLAAPAATLLMMAFAPSRILTAPRGIEETDILARFPGWRLVSAQPSGQRQRSGRLRNVPRTWYRLVRG
jgi:SAM-dependent methyltransferase